MHDDLTFVYADSCRSGPEISQFTVVSRVVVGGHFAQMATHAGLHTDRCSHQLSINDSDQSAWSRVRTVHIAAKTDFKFNGNQTARFNIVLRKIIGSHTSRRTVCTYNVRFSSTNQSYPLQLPNSYVTLL